MSSTGNHRQPASSPKVQQPPRRIVLLNGDDQHGPVQRVLAEYQGEQLATVDVHELLPQFAAEHVGNFVAVEWQGKLDWERFLWCKR